MSILRVESPISSAAIADALSADKSGADTLACILNTICTVMLEEDWKAQFKKKLNKNGKLTLSDLQAFIK